MKKIMRSHSIFLISLVILSACSVSADPTQLPFANASPAAENNVLPGSTTTTTPSRSTITGSPNQTVEPTSTLPLSGPQATAQALARSVGTPDSNDRDGPSFFHARVSGEDEDWKKWIQANALPVSMDVGSGFQDLQPFLDFLSDKRIVLLGEASHNVAEIQQIKVKLVEFLHEESGYNLVAFESSLLNAHLGNQMISQPNPQKAACNAIRLHWQSEQVLPLFEYLVDHPDLKLAGFDLMEDFNLAEQVRDLIANVDPDYGEAAYALENELDPTKNPKILAGVLEFYKTESPHLASGYADLVNFLDQHMEELIEASPEDSDFPLMLRQSAWSTAQFFSQLAEQDLLTLNIVNRIRDERMAANIRFLLEEAYPGEKGIIWAHNGHVRRWGELDNNPLSFGSLLQAEYSSQMYVLGTLIYQGEAGNYNGQVFAFPGEQAPDDAVEPLFHQALGEGSLALLNFTGVESRDETRWLELPVGNFETGGDGPGYAQVILAKDYDGVIYIDRVSPSVNLDCTGVGSNTPK